MSPAAGAERVFDSSGIAPSSTALVGFQPIENGTVWKTSGGREIRANGGAILKRNGAYYWYGMQYDGAVVNHVFRGKMKLMSYSSTDLSHWKFVQTIISYDTENPPPSDPLVQWYGRPDVLFNEATNMFVLSIERSIGNRNEVAFYTAPSPNGAFVWRPLKGIRLPDGAHTMGDKGVFQDADGRAYLLFVSDDEAPTRNNTNTKIAAFSDDYLGLTGVISNCGGGGHEAMSVVKRGGYYYLFSSGTVGWRPSATTYKRALSLSGFPCTGGTSGHGWSLVQTSPSSTNSFSTQHDFVLPVRGTQGVTYVYGGDRWGQFDPTIPGVDRYAWFPLSFDEQGRPVINGYQHWSIDVKTGERQPWIRGLGFES